MFYIDFKSHKNSKKSFINQKFYVKRPARKDELCFTFPFSSSKLIPESNLMNIQGFMLYYTIMKEGSLMML